MPDRMQRSRSPSKTVRCKSFLLSFMASQARISATRSSVFIKSSKLISGSWSVISAGASAGRAGACSGWAAWAAAFWAASRASSSASSFLASMRGKMFSPLCSVQAAGSAPNAAALSQLRRLLSVTPSWAKILSQAAGIKGCSSVAQMRSVSARLYSTRARRGRLASSLASTQGAVSSMYLLARAITANTSASAFWKAYFSIWASYLPRRPFAMASSSASSGPSACSAGSVPPKYLSAMAVVRDSRLPKSLARSMLMRLISSSLEKLPSVPKGKSRSRK